jgi:dTDP-glucose pyrophosphorylase
MLPAHDGRPMLCLAVSGLELELEDLVVTILEEHEKQFEVTKGLERAFGRPVRTVVLGQRTRSQPETVIRTLEALSLTEPFLVKDSDNVFALPALGQDHNYVCVESLNHFDSINPRNKSYLQTDAQGNVTNIREKVVISDTFNVGGYYFTDPAVVLEHYRRLDEAKAEWNRELYISDIIGSMILEGIPFRARQVTAYQDWGTVHEWRNALLARRGYFVLLDGFVFERGSEHFQPRFSEVKANAEAVEMIRTLASQGHSIIYASIRPDTYAAVTHRQIATAGLPQGQVLWSCPIAQWVLLTAPHPTLPFLTSRALEIRADDPNLVEKVNSASA